MDEVTAPQLPSSLNTAEYSLSVSHLILRHRPEDTAVHLRPALFLSVPVLECPVPTHTQPTHTQQLRVVVFVASL